MSSPEHGFRPHGDYAPIDRSATPSTGLPAHEDTQQTSAEGSFLPPQIPSDAPLEITSSGVESILSEVNQAEVRAIDQAVQSLPVPTEQREEQLYELTGTIDLSAEKARQAIRDARREVWQKTGYIPPIVGGTNKDSEKAEPLKKPPERFNWRTDLSEDGKWLYRILINEGGDTDYLPTWAEIDGRNLHAAIEELRALDFIDEADPTRLRLKGTRPHDNSPP
jgi:hypothetical protein